MVTESSWLQKVDDTTKLETRNVGRSRNQREVDDYKKLMMTKS